ncbi:MAG: PQQ-binding-like beta-propeller repeat protein, partial [candidate division WOR-3 bacterium]
MRSIHLITNLLVCQAPGTWPMWGYNPAHWAVQPVPGAHATAPVVKWIISVGNQIQWLFSATSDVDQDGLNEVLAGSFSGNFYCLNGTTGAQKWIFNAGSVVESCPAVADMAGDGSVEVVFGTWGGKVYCLRGTDGTKKWEYTASSYQFHHGPVVVDCDGDGDLDVVIGNLVGSVYCFDGETGGLIWNNFLPNNSGLENSSPAAGDIDGDGQIEV